MIATRHPRVERSDEAGASCGVRSLVPGETILMEYYPYREKSTRGASPAPGVCSSK